MATLSLRARDRGASFAGHKCRDWFLGNMPALELTEELSSVGIKNSPEADHHIINKQNKNLNFFQPIKHHII